jgi:PAS domain S-box-containing protein
LRKKLPISVLIVDDDLSIVEQLEMIVSRRVNVVHTAFNGQEGYELYKSESPDLIISDIDMPVMNGIEFLKQVRNDDRKIPFILSTGLKSLDMLIQAIEHGITAFLPKPLQIQGLITKLEEVAHTKMLEFEVRNSRALLDQYRYIVDDAVIVSKANTDGIITYVNDMFCAVSGYSREELVGQPHNIVRDPEMPSSIFKELWETIQSKHIWHGLLHNRTKEGSRYTVKSSIAPIIDNTGEIVEYIALREDVTDLEYAKEQATLIAKAKGDFLANMSHEIRTPMNGIIGFTDLLLRTSLDDKQKRYLNIIDKSTKTLLSIVNDILDFSKIESGKLELSCTKVNPFLEFENIAQLFTTSMLNKHIDFETVIDPMLSKSITIDLLRVQQVISNLISNAVKFTESGGKIIFYVSSIKKLPNKEHLRIGVRDTGIGISDENQKKIFDAFSQADNSITRQFGGTGLGLSISTDLVTLMGGKLTVESQQNEGSHFYFDLVVSLGDRSPLLTENTNKASNQVLQGKILVVEDNDVNQVLIEEYLGRYNLECMVVENGQEALDVCEKHTFDLILMDINMPVMSGTEAISIIRKNGIKTPVIALTANVLEGDREKYLELGFDNYLSKPIVLETFIQMLYTYLGHKDEHEVKHEQVEEVGKLKSSVDRLIDVPFLVKDLDLPIEIIYKLLATFVKSLDHNLNELKTAIENNSFQVIGHAAHKMKGAAANMRFDSVVGLTEKIEINANQQLDTLEHYNSLEKIMNKIRVEIDDILNDHAV